MEIFFIILTILGLSLFEIITSIDNAVINAEVLSGIGQKARRFFLTWGFLFAVIVVRGFLPFLIVWATIPNLGPFEVLGASFSSGFAKEAIEEASPILLMGGGVFLIFLGILLLTNSMDVWIAYFYRWFDFINYDALYNYL